MNFLISLLLIEKAKGQFISASDTCFGTDRFDFITRNGRDIAAIEYSVLDMDVNDDGSQIVSAGTEKVTDSSNEIHDLAFVNFQTPTESECLNKWHANFYMMDTSDRPVVLLGSYNLFFTYVRQDTQKRILILLNVDTGSIQNIIEMDAIYDFTIPTNYSSKSSVSWQTVSSTVLITAQTKDLSGKLVILSIAMQEQRIRWLKQLEVVSSQINSHIRFQTLDSDYLVVSGFFGGVNSLIFIQISDAESQINYQIGKFVSLAVYIDLFYFEVGNISSSQQFITLFQSTSQLGTFYIDSFLVDSTNMSSSGLLSTDISDQVFLTAQLDNVSLDILSFNVEQQSTQVYGIKLYAISTSSIDSVKELLQISFTIDVINKSSFDLTTTVFTSNEGYIGLNKNLDYSSYGFELQGTNPFVSLSNSQPSIVYSPFSFSTTADLTDINLNYYQSYWNYGPNGELSDVDTIKQILTPIVCTPDPYTGPLHPLVELDQTITQQIIQEVIPEQIEFLNNLANSDSLCQSYSWLAWQMYECQDELCNSIELNANNNGVVQTTIDGGKHITVTLTTMDLIAKDECWYQMYKYGPDELVLFDLDIKVCNIVDEPVIDNNDDQELDDKYVVPEEYIIPENTAPYFAKELSNVVVEASLPDNQIYEIGILKDDEGDAVELKNVNLSTASIFCDLVQVGDKVILDMYKNISPVLVGIYKISMELRDDNVKGSLTSDYSFVILVQETTVVEGDQSKNQDTDHNHLSSLENFNQLQQLEEQYKLEAQMKISILSDVTINFNQQFVIPDQLELVRYSSIDQAFSNYTNITTEQIAYVIEVESMNSDLLYIGFNENYLHSKQIDTNITVEILSVTGQIIEMHIKFSDIYLVPEQKLVITFFKMTAEADQNQTYQIVQVEQIIPFIIYKDVGETLELASEQLKTTLITGFSSNFVLQVVLNGSISALWEIIGSLQLTIYLVLLRLNYPANMKIFLGTLGDAASIQVEDLEETFQSICCSIDEQDMEEPPENFQIVGFASYYLLLNQTTTIYSLILGPPIIVLIWALCQIWLKKCSKCNNRVTRLQDTMYNQVFFNFPNRIFLQGQLEMMVGVALNLRQLNWNQTGEKVSSFITIALVPLLALYPFYLIFVACKQKQQIQPHTPFGKSHSTLYEGLKINKTSALLNPVVFIINRVILVGTVVLLNSQGFFQLSILMVYKIMRLSFSICVKPYEERVTNRIETMNAAVFYCILPLILFFLLDYAQLNSTNGWIIIALICLATLVNMLVLVISMIYLCKLRIKQHKTKKQRANKILGSSLNKHTNKLINLDQKQVSSDKDANILIPQDQQGSKFGRIQTVPSVSNQKLALPKIEEEKDDQLLEIQEILKSNLSDKKINSMESIDQGSPRLSEMVVEQMTDQQLLDLNQTLQKQDQSILDKMVNQILDQEQPQVILESKQFNSRNDQYIQKKSQLSDKEISQILDDESDQAPYADRSYTPIVNQDYKEEWVKHKSSESLSTSKEENQPDQNQKSREDSDAEVIEEGTEISPYDGGVYHQTMKSVSSNHQMINQQSKDSSSDAISNQSDQQIEKPNPQSNEKFIEAFRKRKTVSNLPRNRMKLVIGNIIKQQAYKN